jgi:acetyl esterase/lipase
VIHASNLNQAQQYQGVKMASRLCSARQAFAVLLATLAFPVSSEAAEVAGMENLPENHGKVDVRLFLGQGQKQPLIVGFGGSEGGNLFARDEFRSNVEGFLAEGYAFLAVGYFGAPGTPKELDRISVNAVHDAIAAAARNPQVNDQCIAVIGGSKGAELALLLASHYRDIKAVVGLVPGYAVFVAHTSTGTTPSFSLDGKALPFVPIPESAVQFLLPPKRNLRLAWDEMVKDKAAVEKAAIAVEKINGPILLISATLDEYWPSTPMSGQMGERLKKHGFPYSFQHVAVEGRHADAYGRPELTQEFLRTHLLQESAANCHRR